jgi:single-stranded-DNA-specific exonuclease
MPEHQFDCDLQPRDLSRSLLGELAELGPYGKGNPAPIMRLSGVSPQRIQSMGQDGKHLRFQVGSHRAVWWRSSEWQQTLQTAERVDLLVALEENTFRGRTSMQLRVEDARVADGADR